MNKDFLDINFFPQIKTKIVKNKTVYNHPKIKFAINNYKKHDILSFDKNFFWYDRPQKDIVNNNEVFLKIHRDLNILSKICLDDYLLYISEIFEGLEQHNKVLIQPSKNGFILKAYYRGLKNIYLNNRMKVYFRDEYDPIHPTKMKIIEHGYVFTDNKFIPLNGVEINNPFFETTNHSQLKFLEKMEFLIS